MTKKQIRQSSGTVCDFRIILLQLLSDYSITGEIPYMNDSVITERLSPARNEKRSSPSPSEPSLISEPIPTQEDSEDDFF